MNSTSHADALAGVILRELRSPAKAAVSGEELLNAVVDAMVQANIDLDTVSLDDMKCLLTGVLQATQPPTPPRPRPLMAI